MLCDDKTAISHFLYKREQADDLSKVRGPILEVFIYLPKFDLTLAHTMTILSKKLLPS